MNELKNYGEINYLKDKLIDCMGTIGNYMLTIEKLQNEIEYIQKEKELILSDINKISESGLCCICDNYNNPGFFCVDCKGYPYTATNMFKYKGINKEDVIL